MAKEVELANQRLENPKVRKEFLGLSFAITEVDELYSEISTINKLNLWDIWDKLEIHQKGLILATEQFNNEIELVTEIYRKLESNQDNASRQTSD